MFQEALLKRQKKGMIVRRGRESMMKINNEMWRGCDNNREIVEEIYLFTMDSTGFVYHHILILQRRNEKQHNSSEDRIS